MISRRHPNILYLAHRVPYPPNRGDRIRSFHTLQFLSRYANVCLACLSDETVERETVAQLQELVSRVAIVRLPDKARWLRGAASLLRGRTVTEGMFASRRLSRIVTTWNTETKFDAILVFCSSMVQFVQQPGFDGIPIVVDLVDVDSQKWLDYAANSRGWRRWVFQQEGSRLRSLETSLRRRARAITLVSEEEVNVFQRFAPSALVHAVPNGVNTEYFRPQLNGDPKHSPHCVFVGVLDYRANVEGLIWFCKNVWPEVHRRLPDATFAIVGRRPTAAVKQLAHSPGVRLVGEVPDVRPYLAEAALAIAPLQMARGIQNKVLEALAMGKAVVASPQAIEGLNLQDDVHIVRATTAEEWIAQLTRLLKDASICHQLGVAARAHLEQHYRWDDTLQPLRSLLGTN
jgi:sugar transferase (PEP-CTERM/EpsH1 system associated)